MQSTEQELRAFVRSNFLYGQDDGDLGVDDSFLDRGIIDSTGVLELVAFLEEHYEIKIDDEDVVPGNLDSIGNILRFLEKKAPMCKGR